MHILYEVAKRYPQLLLPVAAGMSQTEEFRNAVLRGNKVNREPAFSFSGEDSLTDCDTPAGRAEILYLAEREDFTHAYQALAYRCEPQEIPASVGAVTISGLINWEKIHTHEAEWLAAGNTDWPAEFSRFTSVKSNYVDTLILLSSGPYSSVPAEWVRMSAEEWLEKSFRIRKYHELTHFVCRITAPEKKDALRDEVYADCIGLIAAFGKYDTHLAEVFLGIESDTFREGGRLAHYTEGKPEDSAETAHRWIAEASGRVAASGWEAGEGSEKERNGRLFDLLTGIY